jgi:hypothetical protein
MQELREMKIGDEIIVDSPHDPHYHGLRGKVWCMEPYEGICIELPDGGILDCMGLGMIRKWVPKSSADVLSEIKLRCSRLKPGEQYKIKLPETFYNGEDENWDMIEEVQMGIRGKKEDNVFKMLTQEGDRWYVECVKV